jgi:penicillin-binding protein 1A
MASPRTSSTEGLPARGDGRPGGPARHERDPWEVLLAWLAIAMAASRRAWTAALQLSTAVTSAIAGALPGAGRRALRGVSWWTGLWADAVPVVGRGLLRGTARLQRGGAAGFRTLTARWVPGSAQFLVLAAAIVTWAVVVTSAVVPAAGRYLTAVQWAFDLPEEANLSQLGERSVVYAADGSTLAILHDEIDRRVVAFEDVPDHVWQAIITAEDRNFFEHEGYDIEAIGRAALANVRARGIEQGGSTITQQLAKMNFVGDEQTFERKASELTYAMALEQQLTKPELLGRYLNEVYFGGGAYGIAAAAEEFFGGQPQDLTVDQAALLAAVVRAPGLLDPRRNPEGAALRRDAVLDGMVVEGYLSAEQGARAKAVPVQVLERREREVVEPYVVEAVKRELFSNPALGETRSERIERVFSGGLRVQTTVDPELQQMADEVIEQRLSGSGPTAAIASVDPATGEVKAIASGADFAEDQFDLATQGRRQPGSAFKTLTLATALEQGIPIDAIFDGSSPVSIDFDPEHQEPWEPENYGGASYGPMTLREAHVRSVNTVFAQLVVTVKPERVVDMAERLGIDVDAALGPESARGPAAMALGGLDRGVTPLEMASAFGTFARSGVRARPYIVSEIADARGNEVYRHERSAYRVVSDAVAATMIDVMRDTVQRGTATRAQVSGWQVAGKTGTTQSSADGWLVGTTPVLSTAVWVGHPGSRTPVNNLTGGSIPAELWSAFMSRALAGVDPVPFDLGEGDVEERNVTVPDLQGRALADALQRLAAARLVADLGAEPDRFAGGAVVTGQDPPAGTRLQAGAAVRVFVGGQQIDDTVGVDTVGATD